VRRRFQAIVAVAAPVAPVLVRSSRLLLCVSLKVAILIFVVVRVESCQSNASRSKSKSKAKSHSHYQSPVPSAQCPEVNKRRLTEWPSCVLYERMNGNVGACVPCVCVTLCSAVHTGVCVPCV
jgi:hypothetical protein